MIIVREIYAKEVELCFELDANSIGLWTKKQWEKEFNKERTKVFALLLSNKIIGVCVIQVIVDEAQLNYLSINQKFRRKGYGSYLMRYLIKKCEILNLKKISLEVSHINLVAEKFYNFFNFSTVGKRINYYRNGSNAVLKEKKLIKK